MKTIKELEEYSEEFIQGYIECKTDVLGLIDEWAELWKVGKGVTEELKARITGITEETT